MQMHAARLSKVGIRDKAEREVCMSGGDEVQAREPAVRHAADAVTVEQTQREEGSTRERHWTEEETRRSAKRSYGV